MKYIVKVLDAETGAEVDSPIECDGVAIVARNDAGHGMTVMKSMNLIALAAAIDADEHMREAAELWQSCKKWKRTMRGKWALWRASRKARKSGE